MSARFSSSIRLFAALFTMAGLAVQLSAAQSLADLAKKEEERREAIRAKAKVYTNKDLQPVPSGPVPAGTAPEKASDAAKEPEADSSAKAGKAGDSAKEPVKDKAYWSGKLKGLQAQLERDQGYATALQSRINALTTDAVNRDDPIQRAQLERDRQKALAELNRLTKAISDDQKAIADLLEDARRAAVPPGWLR